MMSDVEKRCILLGEYIAENHATVRQAADAFGVSKSTVHIDVSKRLMYLSPTLAKAVNAVLQENKAQRHIQIGRAHV